MSGAPNLTGRRFGRWTVLRRAGRSAANKALWACRCSCGNAAQIPSGNLLDGRTRSCGCLGRALTAARLTTHDATGTPEYRIWQAMHTRCRNPRRRDAARYVGRGIAVCARWCGPNGFKNFFADVGPRPSPRHSLDRIDNDGGYAPDNCQWATPREQANNTRRNHKLTRYGVTLTLAQWAERVGLSPHAITQRLRRSGNDAVEILGPPRRDRPVEIDGVTLPIKMWAKRSKFTYGGIYERLKRGLSAKEAVFGASRYAHRERA